MKEHITVNHLVAGSNPASGAILQGKSEARRMGRFRQRPINPFIKQLMDERGLENLKEVEQYLAEHNQEVALTTIIRYADSDGSNQHLEAALRMADGLGISLDEFVRGLLSTKLETKQQKAS